jgi:hypothetical protein
MGMARRTQSVASVTTARPGLSDDLAMRTRRYLITMTIRTVCFVLAIAVDHWSRWVFAFFAVFLPYLGVVGANAGREKGSFPEPEAVTPTFPALPSASSVRQASSGS